MKHYINKLLHILWSIIKVILVLLIWPTIVLLSGGVAILFNVSVDFALQVVLGIILGLMGLYSICEIRVILGKCRMPKILLIFFGWLGPIIMIYIGISLILNAI